MRLQSIKALFGMFESKSKAQREQVSSWFPECKPQVQETNVEHLSGPEQNSPQAAVQVEKWEGERWTEGDLTEAMEEVSRAAKSWDQGGFTRVKQLQEALRNHGHVDLMKGPASQGSKMVAVKNMPTKWVRHNPKEFDEQYPTASEKPWRDIGIVRKLNTTGYPYACDLKGVFRDNETTYVVTSLATEGDLFTWCGKDPKPGAQREKLMRPIVGQIFAAVKWLHDVGVAHRDLSLENILLTDMGGGQLKVRIIDFGMATLAQTVRHEVRGKQSYQAPEMHLAGEYDTFQSDTFALGVVLFAMAAQDYPWTSTKRNSCQLFEYVSLFGFRKFLEKRKLRKGKGEHLIEVFSDGFVDVLEGILQPDPQERLTLGESCFEGGKGRRTVWESKWLEGWGNRSSERLAGA
mmetsp:Transcript_79766/g.185208  ORF Transcript_79766/g.185208 Transcript_79766/m.185208 type:complete len:405 (-) Transcript_79766:83-1297(-)|eukprot:CAMPEP_0171094104 /NCGR_PEP_ID=MMETSP0766_2-20121228/39921_1 /TAXON_ID=439317 /ORGANISM="Gambierdiscus australes, Strain CAWD 149" /LENGTH=404 /DNA_ID=CAMNT_0011552665 /DNA_START=50 /DNA_END=1264 /DNA_ORIENTATION=+